jgi:hypothetical protein
VGEQVADFDPALSPRPESPSGSLEKKFLVPAPTAGFRMIESNLFTMVAVK